MPGRVRKPSCLGALIRNPDMRMPHPQIPLYVNLLDILGHDLARLYLNNVLGNPLESTIAVSHLIFEGVFERHPKLCMCVAHGGGYLPGYFGRMDHAHAARDDCRVNISRAPSEYLRQIYFDTVMFDPEQLAYLARRFGADHLLMGTDYPYDMAEADPVGFVTGRPGLTPEDHARICGGNAARLLGIALPDAATV